MAKFNDTKKKATPEKRGPAGSKKVKPSPLLLERTFSNVMVDLETLGSAPGCVVLSIGAVMFDQHGLGPTFHEYIDIDSCRSLGLTIDTGTFRWWLNQSAEARGAMLMGQDNAGPLPSVLARFERFMLDNTNGGKGGTPKVWGNGASFDQPILGAAYRACGLSQPWKFWDDRCYRSLKAFASAVLYSKPKLAHDALEDAKAQAVHAIACMAYLGIPL